MAELKYLMTIHYIISGKCRKRLIHKIEAFTVDFPLNQTHQVTIKKYQSHRSVTQRDLAASVVEKKAKDQALKMKSSSHCISCL
jgi:hypothetical protein